MPSYAFLALFFFACYTIIQKLTSKYLVKNPLVFNFYFFPLALLFILPVFLTGRVSLLSSGWGNVFLAALCNVAGHFLYVFALYKLDVSVISPLFVLRGFFSTLLAIVFLGEILTPDRYFYLSLVMIAGFFVTVDEKFTVKSFFQKPVFLLLFACLGFSLAAIFIQKGINEVGYWTFNFWQQVFAFCLVIFTTPLFFKEIKVPWKSLAAMSLAALLGFLGRLSLNKALATNVTISTAIVLLPGSMIFAFLFSRVRPELLEDHPLKVYLIRFSMAAVMFYSVLKLI